MSDKFISWEQAVKWLKSQPDKQDLVSDCYYDGSALEAAERYWKSDEWQAIRRLLPASTGRALDLGAGRGIASYALAKDGWDVVSIEPDPSDLVGAGAIQSIAEKESLQISILREFGEKINCDSSSFDLIFARQVLHHAHDLEQLCKELGRLVKPSGVLIAVRDHVISKHSDLSEFWKIHPLHSLYGGEYAYTEKEYLSALRGANFNVKQRLKSFDSVINYAPHTTRTLAKELQSRVNKIPFLGGFSGILGNKIILKLALKVLSLTDNRPGRLYSFVCKKESL